MMDDFVLALQESRSGTTLPEAVDDVLGILERSTGQTRDLLIAQAIAMWIGVNKPLSAYATAALQKYLSDSIQETLGYED